MPIIHIGFLFVSNLSNRTVNAIIAIGVSIRCVKTWYGSSVSNDSRPVV